MSNEMSEVWYSMVTKNFKPLSDNYLKANGIF